MRLDGAELRRTTVAGTSPAASADYIVECIAHLARHRHRYDLVHAHGALSEGTIALAGTALGLPALVKLLRAGPEGDLAHLGRRVAGPPRRRMLLERAWFVAVSAETRAELEDAGVPPGRIFDIPNGVDTTVFRPADADERRALRARLGLQEGVWAAFTGRLDRVKRIDLLVRALADAADCRLLLVGDGPDRDRLERLALAAGVADRVRFTGRTPEVADQLRAADVFATASDAEGLSNALMEAMACGLACLAAPASGVGQLLGDERGLIVPDGAWGARLAEVAGDPALRARLGTRAAEHVGAHLTLPATADRLTAAYRHILHAAPSPRRPPLD
jgi:glycosyltransferase involved in cell wall biosynthesis